MTDILKCAGLYYSNDTDYANQVPRLIIPLEW